MESGVSVLSESRCGDEELLEVRGSEGGNREASE